MSDPNRAYATSLAAALADLGLAHVCISPGSRNTPLIAGFAAESRIKKWPLLDERSAGFFAIGLARATGKPVALACTSGTAAAEYHAAVIEAGQSEVPLLVLTADRPPELRNVGAPQTTDQLNLYTSSARLFVDAPPPDESTRAEDAADLAATAWTAATGALAGPVHLNLPFREPLLTRAAASHSVPDPVSLAPEPEQQTSPAMADRLNGRRGMIVAGRSNDTNFPAACSELAAVTRWPILADPLSGLRHGSPGFEQVLAHGDALAAAGALDLHPPEVILRFGPVPTSKATWTWLETHPEIDQILVDPAGRDATRSAASVIADPSTTAATALAASVVTPAPLSWTERWTALDEAAGQAIATALNTAPFPNEPAIARTVLESVPPSTTVTVGSSMPIRDIDTFGGKTSTPLRVFGNRGANGIDGLVSVALGVAAAGSPSVALLGDISLFHDINSLGTATQLGLPITIIVVNNDGGGIFSFLPQHDPEVLDARTFEKYLATSHATDFVPVAAAFGLDAWEVSDRAELAGLLSTPATRARLIQVRTDRNENLDLHHTIAIAVEKAIAR